MATPTEPENAESVTAEVVIARAALVQVQRELDDAQRRLRLTLDVAGAAGNWEWDIAQDRLVGDARFAALTGQDPMQLAEGLPTRAFFTNIHPDDLNRVRIAVAGIMAGAEVFIKEYRILKKEGGLRWVHADGRAVLNTADEVVRFSGVLVDVTEQKRAQEQLRIAQTAGGIGTFEHADGYGTALVSEQFCRLVGLHPTGVLPVRTINVLVHPDDRPIIEPSLPNEPRPDRNVEFRIRRADTGEQRWLARRGEYVPDLGGIGLRYIGVVYDITESKRKEEQLHQANAALSERVRERTRERNRMWQKSQDILATLDADGTIREVNPAWTEILGHTAAEAVGQNLAEFLWLKDREHTLPQMEESFRHDVGQFEARHYHMDGTPRWISWTTTLDGDLLYLFGRHVTREKQQEQALREAEAQLRQSQKMEALGQLTGGIAHDFNNLLTGIIGSLDIMKRRIAAKRLDDVERFMDAAVTSAQRAASLTHRLLAFSRRQSLDHKPTDVAELVLSMRELLERTLGEQVTLEIAVAPACWLAFADANQLENAILNLAINARDAMPDGGTLAIEVHNAPAEASAHGRKRDAAGEFLAVVVRDTGVGMPPDVIEKAFDPFFTTKPIGQGTGLGLSMVYGFAEQSGGSVKIESQVGKGTAITLYLQRADGTVAEGALVPTAETPQGDGETVLVVEDDAAVRLLVVEVLRDLGYHPLEATRAAEAIPILESSVKIDLLISDVGLPGMNGRQLAEVARASRGALKILFITGYAASARNRGDFLGEGMAMMSKPFDLGALARKVEEMLSVTTAGA